MVPEESGCSGWNRISEQNPAFRHAHSPLRHAIVAPCQRKPRCLAKNRDREDHRPGWVDADLPERCPMLSSRRPRCRLGETPPAVFPRPGRRAPADALHDRPFWPARAAFADTRRPLPLRTVCAGTGAARAGVRPGAHVRPESACDLVGPCRKGARRASALRAPLRCRCRPPPGAGLSPRGPPQRADPRPAVVFRTYLPRYSLMYSIDIMPLVRA